MADNFLEEMKLVTFGDDNTEGEQEAAKPDVVTISREEWEAIREQSRQSQELMRQVLAGTAPKAQEKPAEMAVPQIDLNGLPDPAQDRDGFLRGFAERTSAAMRLVQENTTQVVSQNINSVNSRQQTLDRAWAMLSELAPELDEFPTIVKSAAEEVADLYRQRGVDPFAALSQDMKGFVSQAADAARKTMDRVRGYQAGSDDGADQQRTAMLGSRTGGRTTRNQQKDERPSLFTDEIRAAQKALGLY